VWTTPPDIRQIILVYLLVLMTVTPVWTISLDGVHIFPWNLVFTTVPSAVDYSARCWKYPSCCSHVFLPGLGLFPLIKRFNFTSPLLTIRELGHRVTLRTHQAHSPHFLEFTSITLSCVEQKEIRQIFKRMETMPSYRMGLLHQTVWGLVGTSYRGDPLNFGGSNTTNTSIMPYGQLETSQHAAPRVILFFDV